jgi:S-disulfanyl-L-cysteine oxidoreductase SoxD
MPRNLLLSALCFLALASLHAQTNSGGLPFWIQVKQVEPASKPTGLGRPASAEELQRRDITTLPNGAGLPDGKGTATQGEALYRDNCASCHGPNGEGNLPQGPQLVGGIGSLASDNPVRTVGSFWPYATSVWDYIHRAMPLNQPGSLSADETYAVTAFLLNRNKIIQANEVMSKESLPKVRMPNRDGFIPDARPDIGKNSTSSADTKNQKSQSP